MTLSTILLIGLILLLISMLFDVIAAPLRRLADEASTANVAPSYAVRELSSADDPAQDASSPDL